MKAGNTAARCESDSAIAYFPRTHFSTVANTRIPVALVFFDFNHLWRTCFDINFCVFEIVRLASLFFLHFARPAPFPFVCDTISHTFFFSRIPTLNSTWNERTKYIFGVPRIRSAPGTMWSKIASGKNGETYGVRMWTNETEEKRRCSKYIWFLINSCLCSATRARVIWFPFDHSYLACSCDS